MFNLSNILNIPYNKAKEIGQKTVQDIYEDFKAGLFQNGQSGLQYISQQYKRYKANGMNRFVKKGRLKAYYGRTIESTNTSYVDMTLTGRLKKGLHLKGFSKGSWLFSYRPEDAGKIEGNQKYGREVVGLNDKNKELFKSRLISTFDENIRTQLKDIKIVVKL